MACRPAAVRRIILRRIIPGILLPDAGDDTGDTGAAWSAILRHHRDPPAPQAGDNDRPGRLVLGRQRNPERWVSGRWIISQPQELRFGTHRHAQPEKHGHNLPTRRESLERRPDRHRRPQHHQPSRYHESPHRRDPHDRRRQRPQLR